MDDDLATLANEALARMGDSAIALDDETDLAATVVGITPRVVDAYLTIQDWPFATFTDQLTRDDQATYRAGFAYAFRLSGDRLKGPLRVMPVAVPRSLVREYRMENDYLFCGEEAVFASFIKRPPIGQWPVLFREAMILILAHQFCLASTVKVDMAQEFERQAFGMPSERRQGGMWGQFVKSQVKQGVSLAPLGQDDWATAARHGTHGRRL